VGRGWRTEQRLLWFDFCPRKRNQGRSRWARRQPLVVPKWEGGGRVARRKGGRCNGFVCLLRVERVEEVIGRELQDKTMLSVSVLLSEFY
jgi:hypothetical protein